jgi:hypothetical protein
MVPMDKKVVTVALTVLLLSVLSAPFYQVENVNANFSPPDIPVPTVTIDNTCAVGKEEVNVTFTVIHVKSWFFGDVVVDWFAYSLDGANWTALKPDMISSEIVNNSIPTMPEMNNVLEAANITRWKSTIEEVSSGQHTLTVRIGTKLHILPSYGMDGDKIGFGKTAINSSDYKFTVDFSAPIVSILSPENKAYNTTSVLVIVSTDRLTTQTFYSLDNQTNSTQLLLTNLVGGSHTIVAYAQDTAGNIGKSDTIYFIVNRQESSIEPQPSSTPTSTPLLIPTASPVTMPTLTAILAESASALDFGNRINFTVTVEDGSAPFTYKWYVDGNLIETTNSPYYAINNATVRSHHVYAKVTDANNNTAQTLTIEFNVLPVQSPTYSATPTVTEQLTLLPTTTPITDNYPNYALQLIGIIVIILIAGAIAVTLSLLKKKKAAKRTTIALSHCEDTYP